MSTRKHNKQKQSLRLRLSTRIVIAAGISITAIAIGIFFYLQFTNTESIKAENPILLTRDALPVDMKIDKMVTVNIDTASRNGSNYKIAKPLSLTPTVSK